MKVVWLGVVVVLGGGAPWVAGCASETSCSEACGERECGAAPCGGSCGTCPGDEVCTDSGSCVPDPGQTSGETSCESSCDDLGFRCGEHCGEPCGVCDDGFECVENACECAPTCIGKVCGEDDGCGGVCEPCPTTETCADCPLRLWLVDQAASQDGTVMEATVGLQFAPVEGAARPTIADLRLEIGDGAHLFEVALGPPLADVGLTLRPDAWTGRPWTELGDGRVRMLVMSPVNHGQMRGGDWLFMRLALGSPDRPARLPIVLRLIQREQTLAPPEADQMLWAVDLGEALVLWPTEAP